MYRGFKTYRHYLNYKLHALSAIICGDDCVIDEELAARGLSSVKELSNPEAKELVNKFTAIAKKVSSNVNELKTAIGEGKMTERQRAAIIKVAKYILHWSNESLFSYILDTYPAYRNRLSQWEVRNSKLNKLFGLLSSKDADKIIKRLDQIKNRDTENAEREKARAEHETEIANAASGC
jgi:hypothetical protein